MAASDHKKSVSKPIILGQGTESRGHGHIFASMRLCHSEKAQCIFNTGILFSGSSCLITYKNT